MPEKMFVKNNHKKKILKKNVKNQNLINKQARGKILINQYVIINCPNFSDYTFLLNSITYAITYIQWQSNLFYCKNKEILTFNVKQKKIK